MTPTLYFRVFIRENLPLSMVMSFFISCPIIWGLSVPVLIRRQMGIAASMSNVRK